MELRAGFIGRQLREHRKSSLGGNHGIAGRQHRAKHRLTGQKRPPHPQPLRALARKYKHDPGGSLIDCTPELDTGHPRDFLDGG